MSLRSDVVKEQSLALSASPWTYEEISTLWILDWLRLQWLQSPKRRYSTRIAEISIVIGCTNLGLGPRAGNKAFRVSYVPCPVYIGLWWSNGISNNSNENVVPSLCSFTLPYCLQVHARIASYKTCYTSHPSRVGLLRTWQWKMITLISGHARRLWPVTNECTSTVADLPWQT